MSWEIFAALFETGSVKETAERLSLELPLVSKKLRELEKMLGVSLFDRKTRPMKPTAAASELIEHARGIVLHRSLIQGSIRSRLLDETQIVRIMIGNSQRRYMPSIIKKYCEEHPAVRLNFITPVDLSEFRKRMAEIALVSGALPLPDYRLVSRGKMIFVPVAAREYLAQCSPILSPEDLAGHRVFSNLYPERYSFSVNYSLKKGSHTLNIPQNQSIRWSNVEMTKQAVLDGLGVCPCLPLFCCIEELESGKLSIILDGWHRPSQENFVAIHNEDWKKPYLRRLAYFIATEWSDVQKKCEERLERLIGREAFLNLAS